MKDAVHPENAALDNCDQEPIHRPGRIQPFGALLAGPLHLREIAYASENLEAVIGRPPADVLGQPMSAVFDAGILHDVRNLLSMSTTKTQRERVGQYAIDGRTIELFVHRNPADEAIIELEQLDAVDEVESPVDRMRLILGQAAQQRNLKRFLQVCVAGLRDLTGYDRVMAYRYAANGDGEVVAEARGAGVDSFLGLRYPAWDVPAQARAMQVRNPVRMLSDVNQQPVGLLGHDGDPAQLDISLAHLRGVSDVHVKYLRNMGVGASLTIGLVVEGRLWGMFSCHHNSPRLLRADTRISVELFGQMISLLIQQKLEVELLDAHSAAGEARRRILAETDAEIDLLHAFPEMQPILKNVVRCDGLAVVREGKLQSAGSVPSTAAIRAIAGRRVDEDDLLEATETLSASNWAAGEDLAATAGCMQVRCTAAAPLQLLFFRDEIARNLKWAGRPEKDITVQDGDMRLTPRASFDLFLEKQAGHSEDWSAFDLEAGRELQRLLTQITTKGERAQLARHKDLLNHQRQQDLMIAELNHRVKNILALIRSLSRQAKASSASLESYAQALEQRIAALAAAHDLAVSNTMQGVSLRSILSTELQPYLDEERQQVVMSGPTTGLRADVAPMIALVIHEIVTNAIKYGALSTGDGVVQIRWTVDEGGLHFNWREIGGPPVVRPNRHGFGRSLIERAIPYEFDGAVDLDYPEGGVTFRFTLPSNTLVDLDGERDVKLVGSIGEIRKVAHAKKALVVEDNLVLAMDMGESLTRLGAGSVETAGTVDEANRLQRKHRFDFAVLDMNLRGVVTFDIAEQLMTAGVPFLFVTGYGSTIDVPPELRDIPILTKPIDDSTLSASLGRLLKD